MEFNSGDKINKTNNNCYYCLTHCTIFSRHKIILLLFSAQFQKCISTRNHPAFNPFRTREDQKKIRRQKRALSRVCCTGFQYHKYSHYIMFTKSGTCCGRTLRHVFYLWVLRPCQAYTAYVESIVELCETEALG